MGYYKDTVESEWLLEKVAETDPDIIFIVSPDWSEVLFVNDTYERIWGMSTERVKSEPRSFLEGVHPNDRQEVTDVMDRLSNGESVENEFRVLRTDESGSDVRHIWAESKPVLDDETGEVTALAGFARDITAQKEYRKKLEQANERLEGFTQFLSHDIRNQLTIADGHLDLLRAEVDTNNHFKAIDQAIDRLRTLTNDILKLANLGTESLDKEWVEISELAQTCWKSESIDADAGELVIENDPLIYVSEGEFRSVLENLFRNAIEHTDKDPEIRVGVLPNDDGIWVEDNGTGIDPNETEAVFNYGYSSSGTGLGLTFVREVVRLHRGEISVTEGEDGGARFEIVLREPDVMSGASSDCSDSTS